MCLCVSQLLLVCLCVIIIVLILRCFLSCCFFLCVFESLGGSVSEDLCLTRSDVFRAYAFYSLAFVDVSQVFIYMSVFLGPQGAEVSYVLFVCLAE